MPIGLLLALFTIALTLAIFLWNNKLQTIFSSYYFYLSISLIGIPYFIILRWIPDLKNWLNNDGQNYFGGIDVVKSKVLLLDMCPFLAIFLPIALIIDKKRNWVSSISYFAIVGGGITIFGQIMFEKIGENGDSHLKNVEWWEYIFLNKLYFIMHFYIFILSIIIIMNSKSVNIMRLSIAHIYAICYFSYVTIMMFCLDINWNVTGLTFNDWNYKGQYEVIGQMFDFPWPIQPIVCFILVWVWILIMMSFRNILVLNPKYIDENQINIPYFRKKFLYLYNVYLK